MKTPKNFMDCWNQKYFWTKEGLRTLKNFWDIIQPTFPEVTILSDSDYSLWVLLMSIDDTKRNSWLQLRFNETTLWS